ncbi:MAG: hypothetical protein NT004_09150 [Bacteroidetes bacterium]|nr:hypothetical protein [Bacteroidota bacterium]
MKTNFLLYGKLVILSILFVIANSCKSYIKLKHGISNPDEETPGSLITFLEKQNFPTQNLYMFSDSSAYCNALRKDIFRKNLLSHLIFDRKGNLTYRDTTKCQWAGYKLICALHPDSIYLTTNELTVNQVLENIVPFGLGNGKNQGDPTPDFTIIVTWAKFLGKYNYRLFDLEGALKENKNAKIRLIWLNIDMQKSWHLKPSQKMSFK